MVRYEILVQFFVFPLYFSHEEPMFVVMKRYLPESVDEVQDHKFYFILIVVERGGIYGPVFVETIQQRALKRPPMPRLQLLTAFWHSAA